jgi:hypothetical protein
VYLFDLMEFVSICCGKLALDWHGPFVLCSDELGSLPKLLGGVYLLSAFTPLRPSLTPFYAGQSCDLQRRLSEHLFGHRTFAEQLRSRLSTYFSAAAVSDSALRTAAEAALIGHFRPAGNEVLPTGLRVEISLPPLALLDFTLDGRVST